MQISGMTPRALVRLTAGEPPSAIERSGASAAGPDHGPSGHSYATDASPRLWRAAVEELDKLTHVNGGNLRIAMVGGDIDTSEIMVKRAVEVLVYLLAEVDRELILEDLAMMLRKRSSTWSI